MEYYKTDFVTKLNFKDKIQYYLGIIKPDERMDYDPSYISLSENLQVMRGMGKQILKEFGASSIAMRKYCTANQLFNSNYNSLEKILNSLDEINHQLVELQKYKRTLFFQRCLQISLFVSLVIGIIVYYLLLLDKLW